MYLHQPVLSLYCIFPFIVEAPVARVLADVYSPLRYSIYPNIQNSTTLLLVAQKLLWPTHYSKSCLK